MNLEELPVWAEEFIWALIISVLIIIVYGGILVVFYEKRNYIESGVKYLFAIGGWIKLMLEKLQEGADALHIVIFEFEWFYYLVAAAVVVIIHTTIDTGFVSGKITTYNFGHTYRQRKNG